MGEITKETLEWAYKPFDVVTDEYNTVGFISEVLVDEDQDGKEQQVQYCVSWLIGEEDKRARFDHSELTYHCNLFIEIAKNICRDYDDSTESVQALFNNIKR